MTVGFGNPACVWDASGEPFRGAGCAIAGSRKAADRRAWKVCRRSWREARMIKGKEGLWGGNRLTLASVWLVGNEMRAGCGRMAESGQGRRLRASARGGLTDESAELHYDEPDCVCSGADLVFESAFAVSGSEWGAGDGCVFTLHSGLDYGRAGWVHWRGSGIRLRRLGCCWIRWQIS